MNKIPTVPVRSGCDGPTVWLVREDHWNDTHIVGIADSRENARKMVCDGLLRIPDHSDRRFVASGLFIKEIPLNGFRGFEGD